jgi:hypothetical protein
MAYYSNAGCVNSPCLQVCSTKEALELTVTVNTHLLYLGIIEQIYIEHFLVREECIKSHY